jgi:hypothetical protein
LIEKREILVSERKQGYEIGAQTSHSTDQLGGPTRETGPRVAPVASVAKRRNPSRRFKNLRIVVTDNRDSRSNQVRDRLSSLSPPQSPGRGATRDRPANHDRGPAVWAAGGTVNFVHTGGIRRVAYATRQASSRYRDDRGPSGRGIGRAADSRGVSHINCSGRSSKSRRHDIRS